MVRALLDTGYKKPEDDVDAVDEMEVVPYTGQDSDGDDDDDGDGDSGSSCLGFSSQPRVPSVSHPRQVFMLGRKLAGRKCTDKSPAAKAKQPAKIHGTTVGLFTLLVENEILCR